jgi:hypothetical protein
MSSNPTPAMRRRLRMGRQESTEVPLRTEVIEQVIHELWITGRTIIMEIEVLAVRLQELILGESPPPRKKSAKASRARKGRKPKSR